VEGRIYTFLPEIKRMFSSVAGLVESSLAQGGKIFELEWCYLA
jgi:hypothetical protein